MSATPNADAVRQCIALRDDSGYWHEHITCPLLRHACQKNAVRPPEHQHMPTRDFCTMMNYASLGIFRAAVVLADAESFVPHTKRYQSLADAQP